MGCSHCQRPLGGPDRGCGACGRPALDPAVIERALELARDFVTEHRRAPWLRSAALLGYSLRSRRRGFLDDPARPFPRAALRLLHTIARLGGAAGVSPLAETAIDREIRTGTPALARALGQLLARHRAALDEPGEDFGEWVDDL